MLWESKQLRDVTVTDIRAVIESGLEEHLQLEYKNALYEDGDRGRREFLLDICMFANANGGILLLGVPERRDQAGQPTGVPDPGGILGLELENPEATLASYDARVMEAIEERLPLESASINVGDRRFVLALRISNSASKPHSVRHQGHIYFPSRRERQRYHMNVREIKEQVMRTASRLDKATEILETSFSDIVRVDQQPYLVIGAIPVFFDDFLIDLRTVAVRRAVGNFSASRFPEHREPSYTFEGLQRCDAGLDATVVLHRNGLVRTSQRLPLHPRGSEVPTQDLFVPTSIDIQLRRFGARVKEIYEAAGLGAPFLLGMMLRLRRPLVGAYAARGGLGEEHSPPISAKDYLFPVMQIDELSDVDRIIRPLCDQVHQMFGREGSPSFNAEGVWTAQYG